MLQLSCLPSMLTLNAFPLLENVIGDLLVQNNSALQKLDGFANLTKLDGSLTIDLHKNLSSISAFPKLYDIGADFNLMNSKGPVLQVSGLGRLFQVTGDLAIVNNTGLQTVSFFKNLDSVGGGVRIDSNMIMSSLSGFRNLTIIGNYLHIVNNPVVIQSDFNRLLYVEGASPLPSGDLGVLYVDVSGVIFPALTCIGPDSSRVVSCPCYPLGPGPSFGNTVPGPCAQIA
jgi:hypothetical protein